jgi:hypothetical protein
MKEVDKNIKREEGVKSQSWHLPVVDLLPEVARIGKPKRAVIRYT